jgi:exopolyphosphatase/pppGpp-phosphohydrolase
MTAQVRSGAKRVGIIEIGSRSVRCMVAKFSSNGSFRAEPNEARNFVHGIDVDHIEPPKVADLWTQVDQFYKRLTEQQFDRIWVYGTELCRRLSKDASQRPPPYVTILNGEQEAISSWAAGFLSVRNPEGYLSVSQKEGHRYTIIDQGGGSAEFVSATWQRGTMTKWEHEHFDDLGNKKLAKLYTPPASDFSNFVRGYLDKCAQRLQLHIASHNTKGLILLGSAATKLAFNIEHKRDEDDDYNAHPVDGTRLTISQIADYYNKIARMYQHDPDKARRLVDRRHAEEYEIVMSGAILIMLVSLRLAHDSVIVSGNSTRYGFGFLVARDLI